MTKTAEWRTISCCCPNCGEVLTGYMNDDKLCRVKCEKCRGVTVIRIMGRRHHRLDTYAPREEDLPAEQ